MKYYNECTRAPVSGWTESTYAYVHQPLLNLLSRHATVTPGKRRLLFSYQQNLSHHKFCTFQRSQMTSVVTVNKRLTLRNRAEFSQVFERQSFFIGQRWLVVLEIDLPLSNPAPDTNVGVAKLKLKIEFCICNFNAALAAEIKTAADGFGQQSKKMGTSSSRCTDS